MYSSSVFTSPSPFQSLLGRGINSLICSLSNDWATAGVGEELVVGVAALVVAVFVGVLTGGVEVVVGVTVALDVAVTVGVIVALDVVEVGVGVGVGVLVAVEVLVAVGAKLGRPGEAGQSSCHFPSSSRLHA